MALTPPSSVPSMPGIHPVLDRLEWFFSSPDFTGAVGDFLSSKAKAFEVVDTEMEQPLQNYEIFNEYQRMIETAGFFRPAAARPEKLPLAP